MNKSTYSILFSLLSVASFTFGSDASSHEQTELKISNELLDALAQSPLAIILDEQDPLLKTVAIRLMQDSSDNISIVPNTESYSLLFEQVQKTFPQAEVIISGGRDLEQVENFAWWIKQDPPPVCCVILKREGEGPRQKNYLKKLKRRKRRKSPVSHSYQQPLSTKTQLYILAASATITAAFGWYLKTKFKSSNQENR
jgi:hypothetical protein